MNQRSLWTLVDNMNQGDDSGLGQSERPARQNEALLRQLNTHEGRGRGASHHPHGPPDPSLMDYYSMSDAWTGPSWAMPYRGRGGHHHDPSPFVGGPPPARFSMPPPPMESSSSPPDANDKPSSSRSRSVHSISSTVSGASTPSTVAEKAAVEEFGTERDASPSPGRDSARHRHEDRPPRAHRRGGRGGRHGRYGAGPADHQHGRRGAGPADHVDHRFDNTALGWDRGDRHGQKHGHGFESGPGPRRHGHGHGHGPGPRGGPDDSSFPSRGAAALDHHRSARGNDFLWPFPASRVFDLAPRADADVFSTPDTFVIYMELPGAKKSDLDVSFDAHHNVVKVTGTVNRPAEADDNILDSRTQCERRFGNFEKSIYLDAAIKVDTDELIAKLEDGVLRIEVAKVTGGGFADVKKVRIL